MSTIVSQTLSNGTVSTSTANVIQGCAKAWGSYAYVGSGSTPTLRSAYNISSITRNSAGNYTFAFTNALANANYAVTGNPTFSGTLNQSAMINVGTKLTTSVVIATNYTSNSTGNSTSFDYGIDFLVISS